MEPIFKDIHQIGIVCRDTMKTAKKFADLLGLGPWRVVKFGSFCCKDMTIYGKQIEYSMMLAGYDCGEVEIEFCQPLDDKTLYASHLKKNGEGLQHLAYAFNMDCEKTKDFFKEKNISIMQSGNWRGICGYYYMDTQGTMKHMLEIHDQNIPEMEKYKHDLYYPEIGMNFLFEPVLKSVKRIGIVVRSIDETVNNYVNNFGVSQWEKSEFNENTVYNMRIFGEKSDCAYKSALTRIANVELELIEPLDEKSIFGETLRNYGERLYFVEYTTGNYKRTLSHFRKLNIPIAHSGNCAGEEFVYFNCENEFKHIIKISTNH